MTFTKKTFAGAVLVGTVVLLSAPAALAGPPVVPAGPGVPGPHQHFVETGNGSLVEVGPNTCGVTGGVTLPFLNFHQNVHINSPGAPVTATGC